MRKEEAGLLERCFAGESKAWEDLADNFFPVVLAAVKYVLKKYDYAAAQNVAEDLTQGVFLSLMEEDNKRLRQFRGERDCSLATYLKVLAAHYTIDYLRKKGREKGFLERYTALPDPSFNHDHPETTADSFSEEADIKKLTQVIADLQPAEKLFLHLHFYRELSLPDTARTLNISMTAAYTRKTRLLQKLRLLFIKRFPAEGKAFD